MPRSETVRYVDDRGSLDVERVSARCVVVVARGHLTAQLARCINDEGLLIVGAGRGVGLHDWSALTGYDPEARRLCTAFLIEHRRSFEEVLILATSALVVMGVNVANMGLGGFLQATTDRATFEARVMRWREPQPR